MYRSVIKPMTRSVVKGSTSSIIKTSGGISIPDIGSSFDASADTYNTIYDFVFGTGATATGTNQVAITDTTTLGTWFENQGHAADDIVINKEVQRYQAFSSTDNFVFNSDSLDLTATLGSPSENIVTKNPTSNVVNSMTIPVASTTDVRVGQVVGFGPTEGFSNMYGMRSYSINGTITSGDTVTQTISCQDGSFNPQVCTVTADGASTAASLTTALVAVINGNATLTAAGVGAFVMPDGSNLFGIYYPKVSPNVSTRWGREAFNSLLNFGFSASKTGTVAHNSRSNVFITYIVSKTSNSITVNHPVNLTTSSTVTISPTLILPIKTTVSSTTLPISDSTGIDVGRVVQLSFQDNNLRRITATGAGSITISNSASCGDGLLIAVYPIRAALTNAASTGTALSFASVPTGVTAGQTVFNYYAGESRGDVTVASVVGNTVNLNVAMPVSSGDTIYFQPRIKSAQIWSKPIFMPTKDTYDVIAMELTCELPSNAAIGAWPAFWLYSDPDDPKGGLGSGTAEIDVIDLFTYWNNGSSNSWTGGIPSAGAKVFYRHPRYEGTNFVGGNNAGGRERKLQMIWTPTQVFFYCDNELMLAANYAWNRNYRAQIGCNLAMGSVSTSFNSNGYFPIDASQLPAKFKLKRLRILAAPTKVYV